MAYIRKGFFFLKILGVGDLFQGVSKTQFRRRTFHEPNLIQIKAGPNHENPTF